MLNDRRPFIRLCLTGLIGTAMVFCSPAAAQAVAPDTLPPIAGRFQRLVTLGSSAEDRLRLDHLVGERDTSGILLRSPSTLTPRLQREYEEFAWTLLLPEVQTIWNSDLPFSFNDGGLWAGRGMNLRAMAGARLEYGPIRLILAPEFIYEQNREFQTIPYPQNRTPPRDPFASPLHPLPESADLPLRFGPDSRSRVEPGQTSLSFDLGKIAAGVATENLWWGPGIRNAILLSNQAPGVPRVFLRTDEPVPTSLGTLQGHWMVGRLTESDFFDADPVNDHRSLAAIAVTLRPALEPGLELGISRAVFAARDPLPEPIAAVLDVFRNVGRPNRTTTDSTAARGDADQIFSLFGRWVFPEAGFETYLEWARFEQPASLRDLLETPNHSQGYTLGLQWARALQPGRRVRLQTELTYLEPTTTYRQREVFGSYTSRVVPQGYTHRGQTLGASIGPAGSGQWLAADYFASHWAIGTFGGRVRWENAAMYTVGSGFQREDVSIFGGLRAHLTYRQVELGAEWSTGMRLNYLFQARLLGTGDQYRGVDIENHTLRLVLSVLPD